MLTELSIKNFALLEDNRLEMSSGLNVITGETGSGKSIILEALGLALGRRAEARYLRTGAERLSVAARFAVRSKPFLKALSQAGLSIEGEDVVFRREMDAVGRSRAFVNDEPVSLGTLTRLGELLVYAHGQHEHQLLLKSSEQRNVLDAFSEAESLRELVAQSHAAWREAVSEREALTLSEQERAQRVDLYRYQKQELDAASPREGEDGEWEALLPQLKNADRLKSQSQEAVRVLSGEETSAVDQVRRAQHILKNLITAGAPLGEAEELLSQGLLHLEETARRLEQYDASLSLDPEKLEEVLHRLDVITRLKKKYGPTLSDVVAARERVTQELERLENLDVQRSDIDRRIQKAWTNLTEAAAALTRARRSGARKLATAVQREFREVGLAQALFEAQIAPLPEGKINPTGAEDVVFLFAPNPGEGQKPLAEIASGGELSRVMLALKSVLAAIDTVPVLVFDEIDAGVGGTLGGVLGRKLAALGKSHQVICVTHLASIAACADAHVFVQKEVRKDRTRTLARRLVEEDRAAEISRLLGGAERRSVSLEHARALLAEAGK